MGSLRNFVIHLRLHYQFFILSAPFLFGGLLASTIDWPMFVWQFLNVHILLFGGATAFNSYWDRDEGPIGGLRHPPKMAAWMRPASIALQGVGLMGATIAGPRFAFVYAASILLFWLYSSPVARWKGRPIRSLIAIGLSTGTCALLLGKLAAETSPLVPSDFVASVGAALTLLSLYPVSQLYQLDADRRRGDQTFALAFGLRGVERSFVGFFLLGVGTLTFVMIRHGFQWLPAAFAMVGAVTGLVVWHRLSKLQGISEEYTPIMWLKYATSAAFVAFLACAILLRQLAIVE
jgi:hypothetical protein